MGVVRSINGFELMSCTCGATPIYKRRLFDGHIYCMCEKCGRQAEPATTYYKAAQNWEKSISMLTQRRDGAGSHDDGLELRDGIELLARAVMAGMIIFCVAILLLILTTPPAGAETMWAICRGNGSINVRESPSLQAPVGGWLEFGWDVDAVASKVDRYGMTWYQIDGATERGTGWVCGDYLVASQPYRCDEYYVIDAGGRVAIRDRINGKRVGWAQPGQELHITIMSDDWMLSDAGWIRAEFLTPRP